MGGEVAIKSRSTACAVDIDPVTRHADDVLVILDGSVGSLVCGWREGACVDPSRAAAGKESGGGRRVIGFVTAAARAGSSDPFDQCARLGGVCRLDGVIEMPASPPDPAPADPAAAQNHGAGATDVLIAAARAAARLGIGRVVWAVSVGGAGGAGIEEVADAYDRAVLVGALVSLEHPELGAGGVRIETPLLDLSPEQVTDLALEIDAPLELLGGPASATVG